MYHDLDEKFVNNMAIELENAREKFPSSMCCLAALMEEVGELAEACLKVAAGKWDQKRIWEEALQVAAMAQRVATEGDASIKNYNE
jgi:NTP pyrophosphatase (non-canonical NTP hydrolase)